MNFISNQIENNLSAPFILSENSIRIPHLNKLHLFKCTYDKNNFHQSLFKQFNIELTSSLLNSLDKRKSEYLAGRYCANKALSQLNIHNANITPGMHRAPIWPKGVLGSISHTKSHAFCAVASNSHYTYLGIDYEELMTEKIANEIKSTIINDAEYSLLLNTQLSFEHALTLAFSAKESLFKALYPYVGKYFDFTAAELTYYSSKNNHFELILQESLTKKLIKGMSFKGWFKKTSTHIFTIIAE
ncbi:4'-phosphopantetheinyl transferase family protein [Pseudoalteromonas denitrificans]|uniref:Enterobactin synthase component D n=1 Tax=Pseudoalteromonas denitrificans DSM 6059 TaxID=1123010 RepID=A0A1I1Q143_9GAMM|nr:4'-phosphopantetheinyl transferase superfamily protein [Pseudoalteromonas denitrificans]SFD15769.1 4'-phosphopantetheinyl transferase EntD (siderophore biosynthesis) [Pseudoalteromonas denitrificans DSM 6059]